MIYSDRILTRFDFVLLHLIIMQGQNHMNQGRSIFAQIMSLFPEYFFRQCVARYTMRFLNVVKQLIKSKMMVNFRYGQISPDSSDAKLGLNIMNIKSNKIVLAIIAVQSFVFAYMYDKWKYDTMWERCQASDMADSEAYAFVNHHSSLDFML